MPYSAKEKRIIQKKDVEAMISRCYTHFGSENHKALDYASLISFLWVSGARISEALGVKREDIRADKNFLYVRIVHLKKWRKVKKDIKRIVLPVSLPLPRKDSIFTKFIIEQAKLKVMGEKLWSMDRRSAWRNVTYINPKIYLHLFRHSRATHFVNQGIRESKLKVWFGWTPNSDMPSRYINYSTLEMEEMGRILEKE